LGALSLNGTISASAESTSLGGGSGGSINLSTGTLSGNGIIRADGGSTSGNLRGGGSGGRIAVTLTSGTNFGSIRTTAYGGNGSGGQAAAGTVYLEDALDGRGKGELIIDNNNKIASADTAISSLVSDTSVGRIVIRNSGRLQISALPSPMTSTAQLLTAAPWSSQAQE
jgi:hypothetical protein